MKITVKFWSEEETEPIAGVIERKIDRCNYPECFKVETFADHVNVVFDDAPTVGWRSKRLAKAELFDLIDVIYDVF